MTEPQQTEPVLEAYKLYTMFCSPTTGGQVLMNPKLEMQEQTPVAFRFVIVAKTSAEATRKAVQFCQKFLPKDSITGIEVYTFETTVTPRDAFVII